MTDVRVGSAAIQVVGKRSTPPVRVGAATLQVVGKRPTPPVRLGGVAVQVIRKRYPDEVTVDVGSVLVAVIRQKGPELRARDHRRVQIKLGGVWYPIYTKDNQP